MSRDRSKSVQAESAGLSIEQYIRLELIQAVMEFGSELDRREPIKKAKRLEAYVLTGEGETPPL